MEDFNEKVFQFFQIIFWGNTSVQEPLETLFRTLFMYFNALFLVRIIELTNLHQEGFSREDLFLNLREKGIEHLGQVKCVFLETSGRVSVWMKDEKEVRLGLTLIPVLEDEKANHYQASQVVIDEAFYSCQRCGRTSFLEEGKTFPFCQCGHRLWNKSSLVKVNLNEYKEYFHQDL